MIRGVCLALALSFLGFVPLSSVSGEEAAVCHLAREYAEKDRKNALTCGIRPHLASCTASVGGQAFHGSASLCESPLTGIFQDLCQATVPLPREIIIDCLDQRDMHRPHASWKVVLNTETGEIR
jgi:hypothetical protein